MPHSQINIEKVFFKKNSAVLAFLARDGRIPLLSLKTKQVTAELKMSGTARAGTFAKDGQELITSGGDGTIFIWDLRMNKCRGTYIDHGCINGTSLAVSSQSQLLASGRK